MSEAIFPNANEKLELTNEKKELNSNDLKSFLGFMLFLAVIFSYIMISDKDRKIESLQDKKIELYSELYEYKKEALIQNENILTKYLTDNFHNIREYRVIYLKNDYLTVVIDEPIKTTKNKIGYSKENWYEVNIELTPNSFKVIEHSKIFKSYENENLEKNIQNDTSSLFDNVIVEQIQHILVKFGTFLLSFFIDVEQGKKILNGINQMVINAKIDAIEKPILFKIVSQQNMQ